MVIIDMQIKDIHLNYTFVHTHTILAVKKIRSIITILLLCIVEMSQFYCMDT